MSFRPYIQRLTPWLTAYLFLVSVGLPLQRVYCACAGEEWLTVLAEEHQCHHAVAIAEADIHHHVEKKSCHGNMGVLPTDAHHLADVHGESCTSHDCGDSETLLAQLNVDFTFEAETMDIGLRAVLPAAAFAVWLPQPVVINAAPIRGPTPPPPPGGRALLVAHQTFLI